MDKVKRKRVDWVNVLHSFSNPVMDDYFFKLITHLHNGQHMSSRRCAYYTLKHFYSTTTIDDLLRKVSI